MYDAIRTGMVSGAAPGWDIALLWLLASAMLAVAARAVTTVLVPIRRKRR
ncbi:MAG: hypothetical protein P4L71_02270 [Acetobacteraceae bacterium]|nr:hypothetical protein [Acetobacteraceae bacterium]